MITIDMLSLLREAEDRHHAAEKRLPTHDWAVWYSAYIEAVITGASALPFGGKLLTNDAELHADFAVQNWIALQDSAKATTAAMEGS